MRGIHGRIVCLAEHKDAGRRIFRRKFIDFGNVTHPLRILFRSAGPHFKLTDLLPIISFGKWVEANTNTTVPVILVFDDDAVHSR